MHQKRRAGGTWALGVTLLLGCPGEPPPEPDPEPRILAVPEAWVRVDDPTDDPFADLRPEDATCDESGYFVDPLSLAFEVETELCNYLTVRQPTQRPVAAGDTITIQLFHFELTAPESGEAYLGLALGGSIVWELRVPIPSGPSPRTETFTVDAGSPAGTALDLHVHNHGPNSWEIRGITVTSAP